MAVFVLDRKKNPLMPCTEKRARILLSRGEAVVHRRFPFTIRLKHCIGGELQPLRLKFDPGSKKTGIAVVRESATTQHVLWLGELEHRGYSISETLTQRRGMRRRRRNANLRYRVPRFDNRTKPMGWLAPSLQHRVDSTMSWERRIKTLAPISAESVERVRFDMQAMDNPDIEGVSYQQGTLAGYEVREYLLEKWHRKCAYCDAQNVPLQIEHIISKAKGGSNRIANLTLACGPCNTRKGARDIRDFLALKPKILERILAHARAPLKDAAAVNTTRNVLYFALRATGLPIEAASGGRTKWNRTRLGVPKTHCLDALCVGAVDNVRGWECPVLNIKSTGRGNYQRTRLTKFGFPRGYLTRTKSAYGFQTGDIVRAVVPAGKKVGIHRGRVAIRSSGSFNIQTINGVVQGISHAYCQRIARADGYGYHQLTYAQTREVSGKSAHPRAALSILALKGGVSRAI